MSKRLNISDIRARACTRLSSQKMENIDRELNEKFNAIKEIMEKAEHRNCPLCK
jgi:hypothetical protein